MPPTTIGNLGYTLQDFAKMKDPDGKLASIVETIAQTNEVIDDMIWVPGNLETGHKTTVRTGYPEPTWRELNYGVQPSKGTTTQVTDTAGMLENYSQVDVALWRLNGSTKEFRWSEDKAYLQGMNIGFSQTLFYGDTRVYPNRFMGLAPRFAARQSDDALIGSNILHGGGAGATNTSIWLVVWGEQTCHGFTPKNSPAGFQQQDLGEQTVTDANGGLYQALRTHFKWDCGLSVRDWRYVVRIANIDVTTLTKDASAGADLIDLCTQALERVPNLSMGKPAFYMNRTLRSFFRRQQANKVAGSTLTMDEVAGKRVLSLDGVPLRRSDAILSTEAVVPAI